MRSTMLIRPTGLIFSAAIAGLLVGADVPNGQGSAPPILEGAFPPGGRIGEEQSWTLKGRGLDGIREFRTTGSGVEVALEKLISPTEALLKARIAGDAESGYRELRAIGGAGGSNPLIIRIDHLEGRAEAELGGSSAPGEAVVPAPPFAVSGTLGPRDVDKFRFRARAGRPVTIEVECRRLGIPLVPLLTIAGPDGRELAQAREIPGLAGDPRCTFTPAADGIYTAEVRDILFSGSDCAHYRVRILDGAVPTGIFPLGGPAGSDLEVAAVGSVRVARRIRLGERPGSVQDVGAFSTGQDPEILPFRVIAGEGPEWSEGGGAGAPILAPGTTANGWIGVPGEVDRYRIRVEKGKTVRLRVRAGELGSWLDSVLTLRDAKGEIAADNDEPPAGRRLGGGVPAEDDPALLDSILEHEPKEDGEWAVEVRDRDGRGGPEYPYRLECTANRPEFAIILLLRPNTDGQRVRTNVGTSKPGASGTLNLKRGALAAIDFQLSAIDFGGKVEIRAEGLPAGVSAAPVSARIPLRGPRNIAVRSVTDRIIFKTAKDAPAGIGDLRIVATLIHPDGRKEERAAAFPVTMDAVKTSAPGRLVVRELSALPVVVVGGP